MLKNNIDASNADDCKVIFAGEMREDSVLPELSGGAKLTVDLKNVSGLNSVGTRIWCRWLADMTGKFASVSIEEAPMLFVKAFGQITGALTKGATVTSLQIPYYSETSGERKEVTLRLGEHYFPDGKYSLPEVKDADGNEMEADVLEDAYFSFLKKG
jgi:hypothetical protein